MALGVSTRPWVEIASPWDLPSSRSATLRYIVAAVLHLGVRIPLGFATLAVPEPIPPATAVGALIAAGLATAAIATVRQAHLQPRLTRVAYVVALIGRVFGLTIALLRGLRGLDIWIHLVMLAGLAGGFGLLRRQQREARLRATGSG